MPTDWLTQFYYKTTNVLNIVVIALVLKKASIWQQSF